MIKKFDRNLVHFILVSTLDAAGEQMLASEELSDLERNLTFAVGGFARFLQIHKGYKCIPANIFWFGHRFGEITERLFLKPTGSRNLPDKEFNVYRSKAANFLERISRTTGRVSADSWHEWPTRFCREQTSRASRLIAGFHP